ncbi:hypothetical protein FIBSPDRAFT_857263 [Athelia psychrophila]|uniref:Uncharacterized protein n=1 Tax=Athelia psychrophila TaxID=1759441 RepID=A0A166MQH4_9AGAM|nr:hypothetical protein FIBSPDRAFT_857263 [Fibularhizoctonia sp. CBS 109695]
MAHATFLDLKAVKLDKYIVDIAKRTQTHSPRLRLARRELLARLRSLLPHTQTTKCHIHWSRARHLLSRDLAVAGLPGRA